MSKKTETVEIAEETETVEENENSSTIKVKLGCRYGLNLPNEVIDIEEERAQELIALGVATKVEK